MSCPQCQHVGPDNPCPDCGFHQGVDFLDPERRAELEAATGDRMVPVAEVYKATAADFVLMLEALLDGRPDAWKAVTAAMEPTEEDDGGWAVDAERVEDPEVKAAFLVRSLLSRRESLAARGRIVARELQVALDVWALLATDVRPGDLVRHGGQEVRGARPGYPQAVPVTRWRVLQVQGRASDEDGVFGVQLWCQYVKADGQGGVSQRSWLVDQVEVVRS